MSSKQRLNRIVPIINLFLTKMGWGNIYTIFILARFVKQ